MLVWLCLVYGCGSYGSGIKSIVVKDVVSVDSCGDGSGVARWLNSYQKIVYNLKLTLFFHHIEKSE